jgi:hypothetical protein
MKVLSKGLARSRSKPRAICGGTLLAGKSLFLPNERVPIVVQRLTRSQIDAIPKDLFSVKVLGREGSVSASGAIEVARSLSMERRVGVVVKGGSALTRPLPGWGRLGARGGKTADIPIIVNPVTVEGIAPNPLHGFRHKIKTKSKKRDVPDEKDKTEEGIVTVTELLKQAVNTMNGLRQDYRKKDAEKGMDNGSDPPDGIFSSIINEKQLGVSIIDVHNKFFGSNNSCMLNGKQYKFVEFCLLLLYVFARMGILVNKSRKPFCEFLQSKVYMTKKTPPVRTFNNYAKKMGYQKFEETFPLLPFDPSKPPPVGDYPSLNQYPLYFACHQIGMAFHDTEYFTKLREQRERLNKFIL